MEVIHSINELDALIKIFNEKPTEDILPTLKLDPSLVPLLGTLENTLRSFANTILDDYDVAMYYYEQSLWTVTIKLNDVSRVFTMRPNTLNFSTDKDYVVAVSSGKEKILYDNLDDVALVFEVADNA